MCLDVIDEKTRTNITHGHKVFWIKDGKIYGKFYNPNGAPSCRYYFPYKTDKWYETGDYTINKNEQRTRYTFVDKKEDTEAWCNTYNTHNKAFKVKIDDIIALYPRMNYPAGFHIFLHKKDAEAWRDFYSKNKAEYKILEVEVNNIVASGQQRFDNKKAATIVAKRMKIIGG